MSSAKQAAIRDAVTRALIDVFTRDEPCSRELHIQGLLCVTTDNSSVSITPLNDNVLSKNYSQQRDFQTFSYNDDNQMVSEPKSINDNIIKSSNVLPVQYFFKGTNSDNYGTSITRNTQKSSVNNPQNNNLSTPSMFSGGRTNRKSSSLLSSLLCARLQVHMADMFNQHQI